jgi:hypothetical protein
MDRIERAAEVSVARAVGFAALGIGTLMIGLIADPIMSLRAGAGSSLMLALILWLKAMQAPSRPYRQTEVWLILDRQVGLPEGRLQGVIGGVLKAVLERYARYAAAASVGLWVSSLAIRWVGPGAT